MREFATDVGRDQLNSNRIVGSRHNLRPRGIANHQVELGGGKMGATDDICVLGAWTNEVIE